MSLTRKHYIDGVYADVSTALAAAEEEEKKRREEERRRREEEQRRREEEQRRREELRQGEEQQAEEQGRQQKEQRREEQRQFLEEETAAVRQRLEEQRRRQEEERRRLEEERRREEEERRRREEEEKRRREEEERRRREEEERKRREEEERRRREEERRRREEEERRQREEEERRRREEEERRQQEELERQKVQRQPLTIEEETALIRQWFEERSQPQQVEQQPRVAFGVPETDDEERRGGDHRGVGFDDVVKILQEERDPRKVVERLRGMGVEVEEVVERSETVQGADRHYGWVVRVGDRYIAISSGHRLGRGDVGDYVVMELPDRGVARNFLVGRYWGTAWGDPEFARRAAQAVEYERELDRWMREELGKAGYRVERVEWPENAPGRGFTYVIRDREGRKIGEVQVAKLGFRYGLIGNLPHAVRATGDPRVAALYFVYKRETGDENLAWRLATGDERALELFESKVRYEQELKAREEWFKELTQRGLRPIAHSKIDGRPVVSENDLWLDEKTGVTYRVALERGGGKLTMKLVPATERDERRLALASLEAEGFRIIDNNTVERDGVRYAVHVEKKDGRYGVRLEPYPEDAGKAAEKEPRRYRRGDQRGSLKTLSYSISIEEIEDKLRFGPRGRPKETPYIPVLDEAFYGAVGVPLSQALTHPAGRELYQRHAAATLPGPRVQGFTLPERQALERAAEVQRQYAERFRDVWTPLTFRAPRAEDASWRTAVATAAEAFTFWIPVAKGATALAAARGLRIPGLTAEKTAVAGRAVRLPRVPGDYFEVHYVEPRRVDEAVRGVFVGQGVGEGVAMRGRPGHWEFAFARAGKPAPGWAFEYAAVTYRDVAEWLKRLPSPAVRAEVKPKVVRFTEVRGFARDLPEPPKFEPPRSEPPRPRGREVEWRVEEMHKAPTGDKPIREASAPKVPEPEPPRRGALARAEEVQRAVAKVEEELVRPVRAELPVVAPVKALAVTKAEERVAVGLETSRVVGEVPAAVPVRAHAEWALERPLRRYEVAWRVETPLREFTYPDVRIRDLTMPPIYPFETRVFETPTVAVFETSREVGEPTWRVLETPRPAARTAEREATGRAAGGFAAPPPPPRPYAVRGGYGGGRDSAYMAHRALRPARRGWRVYEALRI